MIEFINRPQSYREEQKSGMGSEGWIGVIVFTKLFVLVKVYILLMIILIKWNMQCVQY